MFETVISLNLLVLYLLAHVKLKTNFVLIIIKPSGPSGLQFLGFFLTRNAYHRFRYTLLAKEPVSLVVQIGNISLVAQIGVWQSRAT